MIFTENKRTMNGWGVKRSSKLCLCALGELLIFFLIEDYLGGTGTPLHRAPDDSQQRIPPSNLVLCMPSVIRHFFSVESSARITRAHINNNNLLLIRRFFYRSFDFHTDTSPRNKNYPSDVLSSHGGSQTSTYFWTAQKNEKKHGVERSKIIIFINEIGTRCMV